MTAPNPPSVAFHREPPSGTLRRLLVDAGIPRGIAATVDAALRADGYRVVKLEWQKRRDGDIGMDLVVTEELW